MSIIIAKIENNECIFMSDTRVSIDNGDKTVTGSNKIRMSPNEGVLKIHILKPRICIAFAGNIEIASKIIQSFIIEKPQDLNGMLLYFQNQLKLNKDTSEFIVGIITDSNLPILFKIDVNEIESGNSFWIGEPKAFNEFQSFFYHSKTNNSVIKKATESFRDLISNTKIDTIGDFIISAYYNSSFKSFIYQENVKAFAGYNIIQIKANVPTKLTEGSVQEGAFIVNSLISNQTGRPAICLYFSKGNIGFLYIPISETNQNVKPIVINANNRIELIEKIKVEFGIELIGMDFNKGTIKFR